MTTCHVCLLFIVSDLFFIVFDPFLFCPSRNRLRGIVIGGAKTQLFIFHTGNHLLVFVNNNQILVMLAFYSLILACSLLFLSLNPQDS